MNKSRCVPCRGRNGGRFALAYALLAILAFLGAPRALHAQVYYGTIVGNVTDPSGAAVPDAAVTVVNKGTNEKFTAKTSGQGSYTVAQLPVGTYEVDVETTNFKKFVANDVEVHTSTNTEVNATLQVGSSTETVTVEANAVQVQTTDASVGEVIDGTQVRELPLNGENFVGLTQLSPGVSAASNFDATGKGLQGGVNFSVNGNPYNNNLFLVDGVNNNDVGSGRTILIYPATDTISEFKMIRNSYGPEYGQASGAIISITTRSGTNNFHGGFFYSGRNDFLDSNDWVSNNNGTGKSKLRRSDWGYYVAGPVLKDRLFLWFNQEWDREERGGSYGTCVPTDAESAGDFSGYGTATTDQCGATIPVIPAQFQAAGNALKIANPDKGGSLIAQFYPSANFNSNQKLVNTNGYNWASQLPNKNNWSEWNVRGDYDVTKNNRVTVRWTSDTWTNPFPNNPGLDGLWGDSEFPTVGSNWSQPSTSVMAKLSSTIHNTMVNDVEFGYGHNAIITSLAGTRASIVPALQQAYPATFPSALKTPDEFFGGWGGLNPYGSNNGSSSIWNIAPYGDHEDLYTVQDNLSKVAGNHVYKAGVFIGDSLKVEDSGNGQDRPTLPTSVFCATNAAGGTITGPGLPACANTGNALANVLIPGTGSTPQEFAVSENSTDATAFVRWHDYEFYVQDSWKIRRNVTVDYGFRWSFFREPYGDDNHWSNWSPAAWSASQAATNPQDVCNGLLVVPGTTPCADATKLLNSLGVPITLSSGTPGVGRALVNQSNHNIAPRVGIAWDVFGNGETALRFGGGQFYQREIVGFDENAAKSAPYSLNASSDRSIDTPAPLTSASLSPGFAKDPRPITPNSWQWNATLEQQLRRNTTFELGYVGNTGVHLSSMYDANPVPQKNWLQSAFAPNSTVQNTYRPATNFGQVGGFARYGHATYHSLQALFRSQIGRSTFNAAYTWSHSIGNVDLDNSSGSFNQEATLAYQYPGLDKHNTNINRPNIFVANEVFFLPTFAKYNQFVRQSVGGWELNSIFTAAHGSSLTIYGGLAGGGCTNLDINNNCISGYASTLSSLIGTGYNGNNLPLSTGINCNAGQHENQIVNPNAFTFIGYTIGSIPSNISRRGTCFGAPTTDLDAQLAKNWQIKEKYRIKFQFDFFDLLNHPNFNTSSLEAATYTASGPAYCGGARPATPGGGPSGLPCSPTNNVITSIPAGATVGGSVQALQPGKANRELQYALHFDF
jgi:hypothetical protein